MFSIMSSSDSSSSSIASSALNTGSGSIDYQTGIVESTLARMYPPRIIHTM